jgi:hypothetical protein
VAPRQRHRRRMPARSSQGSGRCPGAPPGSETGFATARTAFERQVTLAPAATEAQASSAEKAPRTAA